LTLFVGQQEGHSASKKMGAWWRWALVTPDGVAPIRIVVVSASVNLPLHHKVQKFSSGTGSPRWPEEMAEEQLRCGVVEDFDTAKLHTAFMPLLTATSTFRLWRRCQNFLTGVTYIVSIPRL